MEVHRACRYAGVGNCESFTRAVSIAGVAGEGLRVNAASGTREMRMAFTLWSAHACNRGMWCDR